MERYEGMLVTFPETLTVTENFNLGRFGEVTLSSEGRLFNPTNFIDPTDIPSSDTNNDDNNVAAVTAQQNLNNTRRILLDDGSNIQNPSVIPYFNAKSGRDELNGGNGDDSLSGGNGNDTLNGGNGNDVLLGQVSNDVLVGDNGDDLLNGGQGNDTLTGGRGSDRFVLALGEGTDTITDFKDGEDRIALLAGLSFGQLTITQGTGTNVNDTLIGQTGSNQLLAILSGVQISTITAADFVTL